MKLSIVVAVYNHERYIEQAINSILEQNISFSYEVLIADDCSTDGSRNILKNIEKMCPNNYIFIYRDKNIGVEANFKDLYSRMQGEYFIVLEGDDFWIDKNKLETQLDFLENHPNYIACCHDTCVVDENGKRLDLVYPSIHKKNYSFRDFEHGLLPGQTTTIMSRNYFNNKKIDTSLLFKPYYAGDRRRTFMMAVNGKIYHMNCAMSAYRYVIKSGSSFSANIAETKITHEADIEFANNCLEYAYKNKSLSGEKTASVMLFMSRYSMNRFLNCSSVFSNFSLIKNTKFKWHLFQYLLWFCIHKIWSHKHYVK